MENKICKHSSIYTNTVVVIVTIFMVLALIIGINQMFGPLDAVAQTIDLSVTVLPE